VAKLITTKHTKHTKKRKKIRVIRVHPRLKFLSALPLPPVQWSQRIFTTDQEEQPEKDTFRAFRVFRGKSDLSCSSALRLKA
jgi:hypothetical protein